MTWVTHFTRRSSLLRSSILPKSRIRLINSRLHWYFGIVNTLSVDQFFPSKSKKSRLSPQCQLLSRLLPILAVCNMHHLSGLHQPDRPPWRALTSSPVPHHNLQENVHPLLHLWVVVNRIQVEDPQQACSVSSVEVVRQGDWETLSQEVLLLVRAVSQRGN